MAVKLVVKTIEEVPESLRGEYEERDGEFHLKTEGNEQYERNLATARRLEREAKLRAEELVKKVQKWEKLGKTEEEIEELIAQQERDALDQAEKKGEWDKLKNQMNERHLKELEASGNLTKAEKTKADKLRQQIERHIVDSAATAAIAAAKGVPELLLPIVKRFVRVTEDENGEFSTSIVNEKGEPRVNGKGEPLTMDELLAEMKTSEKLGRAFEGSGATGSGSAPGGGGGGGGRPTPAGVPKSWAEAKTPEEKAKFLAHKNSVPA